MQTVPNSQDVDPHEIGIVPENEELVSYVYKRVVREVLARIDQRLADLEKQAAPESTETTIFQSSPVSKERTALVRRWAVRGSLVLLPVAIVGAALGWYFSDNDSAKTLVARWVPLFGSSSAPPQDSQPASKDGQDVSVDMSSPATRPATADSSVLSAPSTTPGAPDGDARAPASASQDLAPLIQKMASDIATLGQGIEQLKMSQDQLSHDNLLAVQQLQAGQDQLVRLINNKPAAQNPQAKTSAPTTRTTTATRPPRNNKPAPSLLFRRAT